MAEGGGPKDGFGWVGVPLGVVAVKMSVWCEELNERSTNVTWTRVDGPVPKSSLLSQP